MKSAPFRSLPWKRKWFYFGSTFEEMFRLLIDFRTFSRPGSGSRSRPRSGSFHQQAKIFKKDLHWNSSVTPSWLAAFEDSCKCTLSTAPDPLSKDPDLDPDAYQNVTDPDPPPPVRGFEMGTFMILGSEHSLKLRSIFIDCSMEIAQDLQFVECLDKQFLQHIVGKIAAQYYRVDQTLLFRTASPQLARQTRLRP